MKNIKYYEVEFTRCNDEDERFCYCMLGICKPTNIEAEKWFGEGNEFYVSDILEISRKEAYQDYAMDEYEQSSNRLVFGIDGII